MFEAGATLEERVQRRDNGGTAFADLVWKPRVLIEMKRGGEDLRRHYRQAFEYWIDLVPDRPAYVVLCNFDEFAVYDLNLQLDEPVDDIPLNDLSHRWEGLAFPLPHQEEPVFTNDLVAVTRESAAKLSRVFNRLIERGTERADAQRFILQTLMTLFAEDIELLPRHFFTQAVHDCLEGGSAYDLLFGLFREMNSPGRTPAGRYTNTPYFNGGLFATITPIELCGEGDADARKEAGCRRADERAVLPLDDLDANFTVADALTVEWPPFETCIGNPPYLGRQKAGSGTRSSICGLAV